ncbi:type II secretion system protein GspM [Bradyrhizobium sp. CB3481]|uniref:type II secretion system protein GspM n=1 Tax=Bradyrhizobium sp. CB3481 TaxID=3039158 RepID=UPI0024B26D32|nr:type II secretion system protein GspM [Bradyrhizobium sp. CB3481]WFU18764.1 type II secretion system protein GspM [Bradyrhizobium sp. CB3481]
MIQNLKLARGTPFLAFNAAALLFVLIFLVAPILGHFAGRGEEISDNAAQLAHFQTVARAAKKSAGSVGRTSDPFLAGNEERVASADLQASLKSVAATAGVNLLAIRGLPGSRSQALHMVAVSVELEGPLKAIRDMISTIENQTPLLFVTTASFRSLADGEDGPIRAELRVQGAIREGAQPPASEQAGHRPVTAERAP